MATAHKATETTAATTLSIEEIEAAKEEVRGQLSIALKRHEELSWAAQQPRATGADQQLAQAADEAVRRIESQLAGLEFGSQQLSAEELERQAAEKAASDREEAVTMIRLINLHFWAVEAIDEHLVAASDASEIVDDFAQQIALGAGRFGRGLQDDTRRKSFLAMLGIGHMADIPARFNEDVRIRRYARELPLHRASAIRALSDVLPEVLDPDVQAEGAAAARREYEASKERKNDD